MKGFQNWHEVNKKIFLIEIKIQPKSIIFHQKVLQNKETSLNFLYKLHNSFERYSFHMSVFGIFWRFEKSVIIVPAEE